MTDRYAVRRSFDDLKSQMGLYSNVENAVKQASDFGLRVYDLETKRLIYEPSASKKEAFIDSMRYMDKTMRADNKEGHQWKYCNRTKKKARNFEHARKQGKYLLNCCDGVHWALQRIGITCCSWYGSAGGGIAWCGKNAEKETRKQFDIFQTDCSKTVRQLVKNGTIQPGDILTYVSMNHTNAYIGDGKSFDSGHAYASGSGEGAAIRKFIGNLSHGGAKVGCILRMKEDRVKHYRVQVGAYTKRETLTEAKKILTAAGFDTFSETVGGSARLFCGSFETIPKAIERLEEVRKIDKMFERAYIRGV